MESNLKLAWRHFRKNPLFSTLNIIGLSSGLGCALLIYLWVSDELHVDKFHKNDKQLYQVLQNIPLGDGTLLTSEHTPGLLGQALTAEMPEVEQAAVVGSPMVVKGGVRGILTAGEVKIKANELYVTRNFFDVFSFRLEQGNKDQVLSNKYGVVISDEMARKLFNTTENVIGRTVTWDRGLGYVGLVGGQYMVSGVFAKPPANSSLQFDLLFSYDVYFDSYTKNLQNWGNSNPATYILLKKGTDAVQLDHKLRDFIKAKIAAASGPKAARDASTLFIQRFSDRYLYNKYENGVQAGGRIEYVRLFSIIAIFILAIACINFMNLSTAKASERTKDVGIRKVVGARKSALVMQYLGESVLLAFISLLIALVAVLLLLPAFRHITGKALELDAVPGLILTVVGIALLTGLVAGSYPALYLSGFRPVAILKGKFVGTPGEAWGRKGLVVFQFVLSAVLIISVLVVYRQMKFIETIDLGYNRNNVLYFKKEGTLVTGLEPFMAEAKKIPGVVNVSSFAHNLTGEHGGTSGVGWEGKDPNKEIEFGALEVDYGLMELLDMKMVKGRMFSRAFGSDSSKIIFNESAIDAMGLKNPIGKMISLWGRQYEIIGIAKDFHFESVYAKVSPCFIRCIPNSGNVLVKIDPGQESNVIAGLQKLYQAFNPGLPFEYKFLEDDYNALYAPEQRVAILSRFFAGVAIVISCLGLFGLASFTAQRRQKEIGIRKVVGASVQNVAVMLSRDFIKLVVIAMLVAFPLSWYLMNRWLDSFAYRTPIGVGAFVIAGASILLITLLTISSQAIKAALVNPVESLRLE